MTMEGRQSVVAQPGGLQKKHPGGVLYNGAEAGARKAEVRRQTSQEATERTEQGTPAQLSGLLHNLPQRAPDSVGPAGHCSAMPSTPHGSVSPQVSISPGPTSVGNLVEYGNSPRWTEDGQRRADCRPQTTDGRLRTQTMNEPRRMIALAVADLVRHRAEGQASRANRPRYSFGRRSISSRPSNCGWRSADVMKPVRELHAIGVRRNDAREGGG